MAHTFWKPVLSTKELDESERKMPNDGAFLELLFKLCGHLPLLEDVTHAVLMASPRWSLCIFLTTMRAQTILRKTIMQKVVIVTCSIIWNASHCQDQIRFVQLCSQSGLMVLDIDLPPEEISVSCRSNHGQLVTPCL